MRAGRMPPVMPPAFAGLMRSDVAGGEVAFTAGADMEFVIGQYTQGFLEKGYGTLHWSYLGWDDEQAPTLLATGGARVRARLRGGRGATTTPEGPRS